MSDKKLKLCMISSSGGHYEQLRMLSPLGEKFDLVWITERTSYKSNANFYLPQTGSKDLFFVFKMLFVLLKSLIIWIKLRPKCVITTGTVIAIPMCLIAKLFRKKVIFIETFARIENGTRAGKFIYRFADLFIVQWQELLEIYPKAVYGGSIY